MSRTTGLFGVLLLMAGAVVAEEGPQPLPAGAKARLGTTRFRNGSVIGCLAISRDGKRIASAGADYVIRLWDARTGRVLVTCETEHLGVNSLSFSPDGKAIASTSYYHGVRLHDTITGELRWATTQNGGDNGVAWSPDGKAVASAGRDGGIRLRDSDSGKVIQLIPRRPGMIHAVQISPDGKQLLFAASDNRLRRWDIATGRQVVLRVLTEMGHSTQPPGSVAFSADGKILAAAQAERGVRLWNSNDEDPPRRLGEGPMSQPASQVAYSADGRFLATSSAAGTLSLWDLAAGKVRQVFTDPRSRPCAFVLSRDGRTLVVSRGATIELFNAEIGKRLQSDPFPDAPVAGIVFLNGGKTVVSSDANGGLHAWDVDRSRFIATYAERCRPEVGLGALPDGKAMRAYTPASPGWLDWEPGGKSEVHPWNGDLLPPLSPDGRRFVDIDSSKRAVIHEAGAGKELHKLSGSLPQQTLVYSTDGKRFAGRAEDGYLRVWDVDSGQPFLPMIGPQSSSPCYLSPGGRTVVQLSAEVRIWEVISGRERLRVKLSNPATTATFTSDGRTLVVGTRSGEILGIDLDMGSEFVRRTGHIGAVRCLRFSADGRLLGSGGDDTTIVIWDGSAFRAARQTWGKVKREQVGKLWDDLAMEDADRAFIAIRALTSNEAEAVSLIRDRLPPITDNVSKKIKQLVNQLDDRRFTRREAASRALMEIGPEATPALEKLLERSPSLDLQKRVDELLQRYRTMPAPNRMQGMRAIEVLERIASPEAREVLKAGAGGDPEAWLTREAKAALERLR